MTIGENIKRIRKEKKLTQKELGDLCQPRINEANIRKYENNKQNPKIETIDRIASALGVHIIDIMEEFTIEQYKTTSEYQKVEKLVFAKEGILAILTDIYGKVEDKAVEGKYGSGNYYLVGEGSKQFILYDVDIDTLYESARASIPFLINRMKDNRPEEEVIKEYLEQLNTPDPSEDEEEILSDSKESNNKNIDNLENKSIEELEAEYKKSRSLNVKKMGSSASNISADTTNTVTTPKNEFKAANQ